MEATNDLKQFQLCGTQGRQGGDVVFPYGRTDQSNLVVFGGRYRSRGYYYFKMLATKHNYKFTEVSQLRRKKFTRKVDNSKSKMEPNAYKFVLWNWEFIQVTGVWQWIQM